MADKAIFEIVVTDKGLKISQKNVDALGASVEKTTKRTKDLEKAQEKTNYQLNQGVTGASSAAKSFSKLNQAIGEGPNGLVGAYATLAANAFAVSAAFNVLRESAQMELVMKGLEVQSARLGITLTNTAARVQELSRGQLSLAESMQATAQASATGFSSKSIEEITVAAQNASIALGRNMGDSMDRLIKGTSKLEPELLDELGIMVKLEEATTKYAIATGKNANSLSSFERRQAFLNAVLEESRIKFGGLSDQVEADPYSQLAASFSNLTKETLSFVNGTLGLSNVISFLAENSLALVSVLVMFAGTISRQLVPSLYEVSEQTKLAQQAIAKKIQTQKEQIAITLKQADAERKASAAAALKKVEVVGSPERVKEYIKALEQGTTVEGQREKAIKSLNGAIGGHTAALRRMSDTESLAYKTKEQLIASLEKQKDTLANLTAAEINHNNTVTASQTKLDSLRKQSVGLRLQDLAQTSRASAIEAAGEFDLGVARTEGARSTVAYTRGIRNVAEAKVAGAASSGFFARSIAAVTLASVPARGALFGLSLGIRALGAALLNAIPIIGQVLLAISLLWEGVQWLYNKTRPEGAEALDKALKDQEARYKSTAEAAKELSRIGNESATAQVTSLTIVGNKVREIAEGYNDVKAAQANLGKEGAKVSKELTTSLPQLDLGKEVVGLEAYKSLQNLRELGYAPLTEAIYKQVNANKVLGDSSATLAQKQSALEGVLENIKNAFGSAQEASTKLKDSLSEIDKAVSEFSKAAITTTPVDALVESTTKATSAIYELKAGIARGVIDAKDFGIQLSGISQRAATLLPSSVQDNLSSFTKEYTKLNSELSAINKTIEEQGGIEKASVELKDKRRQIESQILTIATNTGSVVGQALIVRQKELAELQNSLRTAQALNALDKARYDRAARNLEDSKYAARLQDQLTEAQVARSVKALDIQIKLTESLMHQAKLKEEATLKEIKNNKEEYEKQKARVEELVKSDKERTERQVIGLNTLKKASLLIFKLSLAANAALEDAVDSVTQKVNNVIDSVENAFDNLGEKLKSFITEDIVLEKTTISIETQEAQNRLAELEATGYELQSRLVATQVELGNFQATLTQLNANKAAELAKVLSESEKIARDLKYDTQLLNEFLGRRIELENAIIDAVSKSQDINKNILNTFERQITTRQRELNIEIRRIEVQKEQERKTLEAQKQAKILFLQQSNLDALARKAAEFDLSVINARLGAIDIEKSTMQDIARFKYSIQLVESATLDIYKEGLEIQQQALSVAQKRFSLQQQLVDQQQELESIRQATLSAETGVEPSERAKKAAELMSAKIALDTAKAQLEIKIQGIKLEYELLEAQRLATINEYKLRRHILDLYVKQQLSEAAAKRAEGTEKGAQIAAAIEGSVSDMTTMMGQFGASINELQKYSFRDMIPMAIQVEKNAVRILEARYNQLMTEYNNIGRPTTAANIYAQAVNDMTTILRERASRTSAVSMPSYVAEPIISKDPSIEAAKSSATATQTLSESINTHFPELVKNIEKLDELFAPLVGTLQKDLKAATEQSKQTIGQITGRTKDTMAETMKIAMGMATQAGAKFWQYGAQTGHEGAGHKEYRAIDVYMAPGSQEASNPAIRAKMDALAEQYAMKGYVVLWNKVRYSLNDAGSVIKQAIKEGANQHTTHMHVEAVRAGVIMRDSIKQGGAEAVSAAETAVQKSVPISAPSAAEEGITVTGTPYKLDVTTMDLKPTVMDMTALEAITKLVDENIKKMGGSLESTKVKFSDVWTFATQASKPLIDLLNTLGPSGQATAAAIQGIQSLGQTIISFSQRSNETYDQFKTRMEEYNKQLVATGQEQIRIGTEGQFQAKKLADGFAMAATVIGSVISILQASTQAKIAGIDKEIAAEEKRDGKSAQSIAKLDALEKKKDATARKAFSTQKKLMLAQAVMATAAGVANALASGPAPWNIIMAGIVGAMGLAQVAVISGMQYESSYTPKSVQTPTTLSIGKRGDTVNLAGGPSANAGGEVGYLRGAAGTGTNASNYRTIGSAYGGEMMRGYGNRGFIVGEKGPEVISPETPLNVTPANDVNAGQPINANISIQALDASDVKRVLVDNRGNIIQMLREAANNSGQRFMEDVNVNVYTRPNVGKL